MLIHVQFFCNPMDFSPSGFSVHRIFFDKNTGAGCHFPPPGDLPNPKMEPVCSVSLALASSPLSHLGSPAPPDIYSITLFQVFVTPWTVAHQASLSSTISRSPLKFMFIESMMPSNHLIHCHPLLFLPSIFSSIRVFFNESGFSHQVAKVLELQLLHQSFQ